MASALATDVVTAGAATLTRDVLLRGPGFGGQAYPVMFAAAFGIALSRNADVRVAALLGLACVLGRAAMRYARGAALKEAAPKKPVAEAAWYMGAGTALKFGGAVLATGALARRLDGRSRLVRYALFAALLWLSASVTEHGLHKYVMHCTQHAPWLRRVGALREICDSHHQHHLSVLPDNTLSHVENPGELVFDWGTTLKVLVLVAPVMVGWDAALRLGVGARVAVAVTVVAAVGFSAIWNTVHPDMHAYAGPFPRMPPRLPGVRTTREGLLFRNHEAHHQVKGPRKGNYNVVFLGADELFDTNRL
jgi:hypothetical protein